MEPDAEMILAHKIRTVEKQPVSWNVKEFGKLLKERWLRLKSHTGCISMPLQ
jgi:hypothetical protein